MIEDNSILIANVIFPDNLCEEIINVYDTRAKANKSLDKFHSNHFGVDRKDDACFLDDFYLELERENGNIDLVDEVNNYLSIALEEYKENFPVLKETPIRSIRQKLQKTKPSGGYHKWHHEQSNLTTAERVLTWTIYLNSIEEGGETEFLHQSKRVKAQKGRIVLFPACYTHSHRGNPPLESDKYILTGWFILY